MLGTTLAFGIAAFLVVSLRLGFRAMHRKLGISDYSIAAAVVKCPIERKRNRALHQSNTNAVARSSQSHILL